MDTPVKRLLTRAGFSLFVSLFFMTPICTVFVPFCTLTWSLSVLLLALPIFYLCGKWRPAWSDDSDSEAPADCRADRLRRSVGGPPPETGALAS